MLTFTKIPDNYPYACVAIIKLWCVIITPFGSPVVPLE